MLADLSTAVEDVRFLQTAAWRPASVGDLLDKIAITALGCAGAGYVELWVRRQVAPLIEDAGRDPDLESVAAAADAARCIAEWGTAMVRAHYGAVVDRWQAFEPLAAGFIADRVRSGMLLPLGEAAARLEALAAAYGRPAARVLGLADTSRIRGVNPGYAVGTLRLAASTADLSTADIVILPNAPSDLKPVADIATASGQP